MEIQDVKNQLSITVVLNHYKLSVDRNNCACCPWHDDETPSLQIYPKTNTWTCFSCNCSAGSGDVIDFIMKYDKVTKHEALLKAKEMIAPESNRKKGEVLSWQAVLMKFYQSAVHSFVRNKAAKAYVESRGLKGEGIGYAGYMIGKSWNKEMKLQAEKLGLMSLKNCLIFPLKNEKGQVVSFYGRSISGDDYAKHFYLTGGFRGLYPGYVKKETKRIVLTESTIDASTLRQYCTSFRSAQCGALLSASSMTIKEQTNYEVLALNGTNGWTKEHEQSIKKAKALEEIILFFDGDEAGKAAVTKYTNLLKELVPQVEVSYVETPLGEDPIHYLNHMIKVSYNT